MLSFLFISFHLIASDIEFYQIIDIGVLDADESRSIAINDRNQVLGKLKHNGRWEFFLWDQNLGIQVLNLPENSRVILNNNGQIAGTYEEGLFIWDPVTGFYSIGNFDGGYIAIQAFNDHGQILFYNYSGDRTHYQIYLWEGGTKFNITKDFKEQFPDYNSYVEAIALNNRCQVVVQGRSIQKDDFGNSICKSFIWTGGTFAKAFKEYDDHTNVHIHAFDDNRNMLVHISSYNYFDESSSKSHSYFVNPTKGIQAEHSYDRELVIRNGAPQVVFCLPSELRVGYDGISYYLPGIEIRKIMKPCFPYWFDQRTFRIIGQNSSGYVVGNSETVYADKKHAFLAIPRS